MHAESGEETYFEDWFGEGGGREDNVEMDLTM
jgi:hypothetical protein